MSGPARATRVVVPVKGAMRRSNQASVRPMAALSACAEAEPDAMIAHLGMVGARKTDLGAEGAPEAVANDEAVWGRRGERPLSEHGRHAGINLAGKGGRRSDPQRGEHHDGIAHASLPANPSTNRQSTRSAAKVRPAIRHGIIFAEA